MLIFCVGLSSLFLYSRLPVSPFGGNSIKWCSVLLILLTCQLAINCKKHCTQKGKRRKKKKAKKAGSVSSLITPKEFNILLPQTKKKKKNKMNL